MAIPFYENEEHLQQHQPTSEEIDQVDGPVMHNPTIVQNLDLNSPPINIHQEGSYQANPVSVNPQDFMAWKILALAMCKALKDHYQQNMANTSSSSSSAAFVNSSNTSAESQTAVIQILPNGQVKPQWN